MTVAYDDYIAKMISYESATSTAESLIRNLSAFASPLFSDWKRCTISIHGQSTPMDMLANRQEIDGNHVPTPLEIKTALTSQFQAKKEASYAWGGLSEQEQKQLKPPPWLKM